MESNEYAKEILLLINDGFMNNKIDLDDLQKILSFTSHLKTNDKITSFSKKNLSYCDNEYLDKFAAELKLSIFFFQKIEDLDQAIIDYEKLNISPDILPSEFNIKKSEVKDLIQKYFDIKDPTLKSTIEFVKIYFLKVDASKDDITVGFTLSSKELLKSTAIDETFDNNDFCWELVGGNLKLINITDFKMHFELFNNSPISKTIMTKILSFKLKDLAVFESLYLNEIHCTHLHCRMIAINGKVTIGFRSKMWNVNLSDAYDFGTVYP